MAMIRRILGGGAWVWLGLLSSTAWADEVPASYEVVWESPSENPRGSMPLGNGDVGLNVWVLRNGAVHLLISKTDAWDENARLVKVGQVVVRFPPECFARAFRQQLDVRTATIRIATEYEGRPTEIRIWVDALHPVIRVDAEIPATATIELWRTNRSPIMLQCSDILHRAPPPHAAQQWAEPDTVCTGWSDRIGWYHHNVRSLGFELTRVQQGLTGFSQEDPILHRIFGAVVTAQDARKLDDTRLQSRHGFQIHVLTLQPASPAKWVATMDDWIRDNARSDYRAHTNWWAEFWSRSWIHARRSRGTASLSILNNGLPFQIGQDQRGENRFAGELQEVRIQTNTAGRLVIGARVRPAAGETGRIVDKITPGGRDGFLLDAHPGNSLRIIAGDHVWVTNGVLPANRWAQIRVEGNDWGWRVELNEQVLVELDGGHVADDAALVSHRYALQRFITACAGRGAYPIKFNGSIFTVAPDPKRDHDVRRWGPGYWWQNTRLPYYPMCAAGDMDLMRPLFRMYAQELVPLCRYRTRLYCGHEGIFYPECIYFWGAIFPEVYGWTPFEQRADKLQESGYHKWEWVGGLELAWLLLDYYDYTLDRDYFQRVVWPVGREVLTFFDQHYPDGSDGRMRMHPAQACETWWDCTNPMPELAGCIAVSERLLGMTELSSADRQFLSRFRARLPPLPVRQVNGETALAPAAEFAHKRNIENPELYAVFPFRLIAIGRPNTEWGWAALRHRWDRGHSGWRQDDIFMAYLGLAEDARRNLVARARHHDPQERFPAFWGPNYDWTPDQCHGGVLMKAFQSMLLQTDGRRIYLLPAWPADWDADFKLHAPYRTVVEGKVRNGRLTELRVTPPERRADIVVWPEVAGSPRSGTP
jgi:hypothetical protein